MNNVDANQTFHSECFTATNIMGDQLTEHHWSEIICRFIAFYRIALEVAHSCHLIPDFTWIWQWFVWCRFANFNYTCQIKYNPLNWWLCWWSWYESIYHQQMLIPTSGYKVYLLSLKSVQSNYCIVHWFDYIWNFSTNIRECTREENRKHSHLSLGLQGPSAIWHRSFNGIPFAYSTKHCL